MSGNERATRVRIRAEPDLSAGGTQMQAGRACGGERMGI